MSERRSFLKKFGLSIILSPHLLSCEGVSGKGSKSNGAQRKIVLSTWRHKRSNALAFNALENGTSAMDAIETGIRDVESDPSDSSVGLGGRPDRSGEVTLDACIMDHNSNAGAVSYLKQISHPISVARKVLEDSPHTLLSGEGALRFALEKGFHKSDLLTEESKNAWSNWKQNAVYQPEINIENHDTIGMLCIDASGIMAGGCSTSGLAYKMEGRVGDSPIPGAGLYVDGNVGGAVATGLGEKVIKNCSTFYIVELIRQGYTPQKACEMAIQRVIKRESKTDFQVGFLAVDKFGDIGAFSIHPGFIYTYTNNEENTEHEANAYFDKM